MILLCLAAPRDRHGLEPAWETKLKLKGGKVIKTTFPVIQWALRPSLYPRPADPSLTDPRHAGIRHPGEVTPNQAAPDNLTQASRKLTTIARRHGDKWYLGSMTNWDARDLELPLNFLGQGECEAQIFSDGPDADTVGTSLSINTRRVKAGDKLNVHLAPGGGVAVIFTLVS
jgi:hypothetical protein